MRIRSRAAWVRDRDGLPLPMQLVPFYTPTFYFRQVKPINLTVSFLHLFGCLVLGKVVFKSAEAGPTRCQFGTVFTTDSVMTEIAGLRS
ncbi:unnamed protein product [Protopolystoma xenopodis]|uniref:Uncharacterized protein n=1 Tax=Protopolystoma xenopodis TaxID=117903 RepID=A0A3S5CD00_9PLAT|nr:unnamed protein product [Protopolystoma xenopodis]